MAILPVSNTCQKHLSEMGSSAEVSVGPAALPDEFGQEGMLRDLASRGASPLECVRPQLLVGSQATERTWTRRIIIPFREFCRIIC